MEAQAPPAPLPWAVDEEGQMLHVPVWFIVYHLLNLKSTPSLHWILLYALKC